MEQSACHFVFYTGPLAGQAESFATARVTIGRAGNCDFRIDALGNDSVSSHHAEIILEEGTWYLYDLSKSGCFVNSERVDERCALVAEDYIQFGEAGPEVIFRTGPAPVGYQPLPKIFPEFAQLEFFAGSDAGRVFHIDASRVTRIGRRTELEIPLDPRGDMIVSGNHCSLTYEDDRFVLTDTSRNGTYINGELVDGSAEAGDGDIIMLGDGGPQARLQVDHSSRRYPNRRPLTASITRAAKETAGPGAAALLAVPKDDPPVAAVEPSAVETAPESAALPDFIAEAEANFEAEPEMVSPDPGDDVSKSSSSITSSDEVDDFGAESDLDEMPTGDSSTPAEGTSALGAVGGVGAVSASAGAALAGAGASAISGGSATVSGTAAKSGLLNRGAKALSFPRMRPLSRPAILITAGALTLLGLIILISALNSDAPKSGSVVATPTLKPVDFSEELKELEPVDFERQDVAVQIPRGWTSHLSSNGISVESGDKQLALDYFSDAALNDESVRRAIGRNGGQVVRVEGIGKSDSGATLKTYVAKAGRLSRMAVLHEPAGAEPVMAMLETTNDVLESLSPSLIDQLLVKNVTLPQTAPPPVPQVTPSATAQPTEIAAAVSPGPVENLPTPVETPVTETPVPSPAITPPPTPEATPEPTSTPAPSPTSASPTPAAPAGPKVESKAMNLAITLPAGWDGTSEESDAMITLKDSQGLELRVARDPGKMNPTDTFNAMKQEGWTLENTKPESSFTAAEFSKSDQHLMLILVPEPKGTTLVLYATSDQDFSLEQRSGIVQTIRQVRPTAGR